MKKKLRFLAFIITLSFALLHGGTAQSQGHEDRPIAELTGGHLRTKFVVSGSGRLWGFACGPSDWTAFSPAGLALSEKRTASIGWVPGFSQNLQKWYDADGKVREKMDGLIRDHGSDESQVAYPSLSVAAGFESSPMDWSIAVPFQVSGRRFGIGIGCDVPLSVDFSFTGTGIEAGIDTEQDIQGERKRLLMRTRSGLDGSLDLRISRLWFGAGAGLGRGFFFGAALCRTSAFVEAHARAGVDGIVSISGNEYTYNDPFDPRIDFGAGEQNDINQRFDADLSGSGWGIRLDLVKALTPSWRIHLSADMPPSINLDGLDSLVNNRVPFIRIEDGGSRSVDDMIDPAKIDLAKLTKTERIVKSNRYDVTAVLPKTYGVGAEWIRGKTSLSFGAALYSGEASVSADEKTLGLRPEYGLRMEADFRWFFIGAEAEFAKEISDRESGDGGGTVVLPRVHLGFRVMVARSLDLEGQFEAEPFPAAVLRGVYRF